MSTMSTSSKPLVKKASPKQLEGSESDGESTVASEPDMVDTAAKEAAVAKELAQRELQGVNEVFINGVFYDVTNFKHPGGGVIKFLQGSGDASATFEQFHIRSKKAAKVLASLPKRSCPDVDAAKIVGGKEELEKDFIQLSKDLKSEGFFEPHIGHIIYRFAEIFAIFALGFYLLWCSNFFALRAVGIVLIGLAEGRCGWLMHEGGHGSMTGHIKTDRNLQVWVFGFGCAMSAGWWRSQHNKHHAAPQKLQHDADLDTLPLVAFNAACTKGIRSPTLRKWLQAQAYLFMPFTCFLVVLGWQVFLHPRYMQRTGKHMEMFAVLMGYYVKFGWLLSGYSWPAALGCYFLVQQIAGAYIFTNFAMSHTHLDVTQPDEHIHWCEYSCNHTTNLSNHWFVNWWMAYLNFQIEHHMFPTMPQFRHPKTSLRVQALFQKHGLNYDTRGYFSCLGDTLKNLQDVGAHEHTHTKQAKKDQ